MSSADDLNTSLLSSFKYNDCEICTRFKPSASAAASFLVSSETLSYFSFFSFSALSSDLLRSSLCSSSTSPENLRISSLETF
jgi:hypothetical protein